MPAQIAILDRNGVILETNRAWREFAGANGGRADRSMPKVNYLKVCDRAKGPASEQARQVARGIRAVIRGDVDEFLLDYPCHSPDEKRWFYMRVSRVAGTGLMRAVLSHENITPLKLAEESLKAQRVELQQKAFELEEANTALRVLLKQRERDRGDLEQNVLRNLRELVFPHLDRLKAGGFKAAEKGILETIRRQLNELVSPLLQRISNANLILTPQEIHVAALVRDGRSSKEIASTLRVSLATVNFHRKNLRRKFGLGKSPANLRTYLLTMGE
jgi:DNA-binding CsgD family transcriptional regulator